MKAALAASALLLSALPAHAQGRPQLEAAGAWTRPAAAGMTAAGYLTIVNRGPRADALVGVETPAARKASLHVSSMAGGVMRMAPEARAPIPARGETAFAPGGRHVMFEGLTRPLKPGDSLPATLRFASGARLQVQFAVRTEAPGQGAHGMSGHDMSGQHAPMGHGGHMN